MTQHEDLTEKLAAAEYRLQSEIEKSFSLYEDFSKAQQVRSALTTYNSCIILNILYVCIRVDACLSVWGDASYVRLCGCDCG